MNLSVWTCAPSEDSDQTAHSRSLIRIFTAHFVSETRKRRLWSGSAGLRRLIWVFVGRTCQKDFLALPLKFKLAYGKTNKMACAPSEDSDQPGYPPSLIRVFAVRTKKAWILSYPLSAQRRLWSDWTDAQADPSLRWAHMPFCWICHALAQFYLITCTSNEDSYPACIFNALWSVTSLCISAFCINIRTPLLSDQDLLFLPALSPFFFRNIQVVIWLVQIV